MKNRFLALFAVAAIGISCNDSSGLVGVTTPDEGVDTRTFTLSAVVGDTPSSRALFDDQLGEDISGTIDISWESGDSFVVTPKDGDGSESYTFIYMEEENLFGTYDGALTDNTEYVASFGSIEAEVAQSANGNTDHLDKMLTFSTEFTYSESDNSGITFAHDMAILRIKFTATEEVVTTLNFEGGENDVTLSVDGAEAGVEYTAYLGVQPMASGVEYSIVARGESGLYNYTYTASTSQAYEAGYSYGGTFDLTQQSTDPVVQSSILLADLTGTESFTTDSPWVVEDAGELDITSDGFAKLIELINDAGSGVVSLELPNITSIPDTATSGSGFYGCTGLGTITFNSTEAVTLGMNALRDCKQLSSVVNLNNVSSFGEAVFMNCNALASGVDVSGATVLPKNLLRECTLLTSITGLDDITTLGDGALRNTSFTSLTFPSVVNLNGVAFYNCLSLTELKFTTDSAITLDVAFPETTYFDTTSCTLTLGSTEAGKVTEQSVWKSVTWAQILDTNGSEVEPTAPSGYDDSSNITLSELTGTENFDPAATWSVADGGEIEAASLTTLATLMNSAGAGTITLEMPNATALLTASGTGVGLYGCTGLGSLILSGGGEDGVTIGESAIRDCSNLTTLVANISSVGKHVFRSCGLVSATFTYSGTITFGLNSFRSVTTMESMKFTSDTATVTLPTSNFMTTTNCSLELGATEYANANASDKSWGGYTWSSITQYAND